MRLINGRLYFILSSVLLDRVTARWPSLRICLWITPTTLVLLATACGRPEIPAELREPAVDPAEMDPDRS